MEWSDWIECSFDSQGEIDTRPVVRYAPESPGIYAIATKTGWGYRVQYIGMSTRNIYRRLKAHFDERGNHTIKAILEDRKKLDETGRVSERGESGRATEKLDALYFAFLELSPKEVEVMEAIYIDGTEPIGNLVRGRVSKLPPGLQESERVERED